MIGRLFTIPFGAVSMPCRFRDLVFAPYEIDVLWIGHIRT
jgi:hypothetical protein